MESAGLHIIMDARVHDATTLESNKLVYLFRRLVEALEMKPLDKVLVYEVPVDEAILERVRRTGHFEDEGGVSTIQVISTSHLALHAWPLQKYFAFDGFSCKDFNAELALTLIRETLNLSCENTLVIRRKKPAEGANKRNVVYYEVAE